LYEKPSDSKEMNCVLQGHYDGELWGCATSSITAEFVSCGGDKTIRKWDSLIRKMVVGT